MDLRFILVMVMTVSGAPDGRIMNGQPAQLGQFPHQVMLKRNGSYVCGGSIISKEYILTAAHCIVETGSTPYPPDQYLVVAGSVRIDEENVRRIVDRIVVHHSFSPFEFRYDLALIRLREPLVFNEHVNAIELYEENISAGANVTISGFGKIYDGGPFPEMLQYNTVETLSDEECFRESRFYYDGLLCLAHPRDNGACHGDQGSPALVDGKLVGVANFIYPRCGSSSPDGYAKIPHFLNWIQKNVS